MALKLNVALVVLLALGVGCGRSSNSTTYKTKDGEVKIDQKSGQASYELNTKEGKVKMSTGENGVAVPENFPKDVPLYKGAKVKMAMSQGKLVVVYLQTTDSAADGIKFYQDQLKSQGWEIESSMNVGEMQMLTAKKDQRQCSVVATKSSEGTMIQVHAAPEGS